MKWNNINIITLYMDVGVLAIWMDGVQKRSCANVVLYYVLLLCEHCVQHST